jgi:hypothetical protein
MRGQTRRDARHHRRLDRQIVHPREPKSQHPGHRLEQLLLGQQAHLEQQTIEPLTRLVVLEQRPLHLVRVNQTHLDQNPRQFFRLILFDHGLSQSFKSASPTVRGISPFAVPTKKDRPAYPIPLPKPMPVFSTPAARADHLGRAVKNSPSILPYRTDRKAVRAASDPRLPSVLSPSFQTEESRG